MTKLEIQNLVQEIGNLSLQKQVLEEKISKLKTKVSEGARSFEHAHEFIIATKCSTCDGTGNAYLGACISCYGTGERYSFVIPHEDDDTFACKIYEVAQHNFNRKKAQALLDKKTMRKILVENRYEQVDVRPTKQAKLKLVSNG